MELVVLDASVCAKWILAEPETAAANELLEGRLRLLAPSLIRVEVAAAAIRRFRLDKLSEDLTRSACRKWDRLVEDGFIQLVPFEDLYDNAVELSFRCRHSLADCLYLAAAVSMNCRLLTADRLLFDRAKTVHDQVELFAKAA